MRKWNERAVFPAVALFGLALSQAINSIKLLGGNVFLAENKTEFRTSGEIGVKSFKTS
jgi:hypothetical protein